MGMFDELKIDKKFLPEDLQEHETGWQTKIKMKLETQLFNECISRNYNCSITYQRINDYSVEIYRGYQSNYEKIFYTDGHIDREKAIRKALKFLRNASV